MARTARIAQSELLHIEGPGLCLDEVSCWLDEVQPVLRSLVRSHSPISPGVLAWVDAQKPFLREVAAWVLELEAEAHDIEDHDRSVELAWTITRLSAVTDMAMTCVRRAPLAA